MRSKRTRLDRFLSQHLHISKKAVRGLVAQGRVKVDQCLTNDVQHLIDQFTHVQCDDQILQAETPNYLMLNKPRGVVSATLDDKHRTVIELLPSDLLPDGNTRHLHIAGRLDLNSTGLVLLTNDGRWSRRLSTPESKIKKRYRVGLDKPINAEVIQTFAEGMFFAYENVTTRPALLIPIDQEIDDIYSVEVVLEEGRYHQIKRMFGHFQITVLTLHRTAIGKVLLDPGLQEGDVRHLTPAEVAGI